LEKAIEAFQEAFEIIGSETDRKSKILKYLGKLYLKQDRLNEARESLEKAVALGMPLSANTYINLTKVYLELGEFKLA